MQGSTKLKVDEDQFLQVDWSHTEDEGFQITGVYAGNVELYNSMMLAPFMVKACDEAADKDAEMALRGVAA